MWPWSMTEVKWLRLKKSWPMLKYLRGKVSDRKFWLFVVAFWRDASKFFSEETCRLVSCLTEQVADQLVPTADHRAVLNALQGEFELCVEEQDFERADGLRFFWDILFAHVIDRWRMTDLGQTAVLRDPLEAYQRGFDAARWVTYFDSQPLSDSLRDIMGNPFRPASLFPFWLTWHDGLIVSMARQIYETRNFTDMSILADALEEAGCTNVDILNHCRQPGEHVRGCWVIDLLLGKE